MASIEPAGSRWQLYGGVRLAALLDTPRAFGSTYAREAAFDEATWQARAGSPGCLLALDDGEVVGTATGFADPDGAAHERLLVAMWVVPAARGQRVAGTLIAAVAAWARRDGARELWLEVAVDNAAARSAYLRAGFRSTGRIGPMPRDPSILEEAMVLDLVQDEAGGAAVPL